MKPQIDEMVNIHMSETMPVPRGKDSSNILRTLLISSWLKTIPTKTLQIDSRFEYEVYLDSSSLTYLKLKRRSRR